MNGLAAAYQAAGVLAGAISLIALAVMIFRGKAQHQIATEWKDLAQAKAAKISDLEERVNHLESELRQVRTENDEYRRLNLTYQAEVVALRQEVAELKLAAARAAHAGRG